MASTAVNKANLNILALHFFSVFLEIIICLTQISKTSRVINSNLDPENNYTF